MMFVPPTTTPAIAVSGRSSAPTLIEPFPVRDAYRISNELLFIEELVREYQLTDEQIAAALGWNPSLHSVAGNAARLFEEYRRKKH